MANTFFTSDLHLGHKNIIKFGRPFSTIEEHDQAILDNWNRTVSKRDTVYVLGDVAFPRRAAGRLGELNGTKKLIMGNHDWKMLNVLQPYFSQIGGCAQVWEWVLTHIPVHPEQLHRFKANIHGHLHAHNLDDPRYVNVSLEQTDYRPISLEEIKSKLIT